MGVMGPNGNFYPRMRKDWDNIGRESRPAAESGQVLGSACQIRFRISEGVASGLHKAGEHAVVASIAFNRIGKPLLRIGISAF